MTQPSNPARRVVLFAVGLLVAIWATTDDSPVGRRALAQAPDIRSAMLAPEDEIQRLKVMMGFADTASVKEIESAFKADMETHGAKAPEELLTYRGLLQFQVAEIDKLKQLSEHLEKVIKRLQHELESVDQAHREQLASRSAAATHAMQELAMEREKFDHDRTQLGEENTKLQEVLVQKHKRMDAEREQLNTQLQRCSETITRLRAALLKHGIDPKEAVSAGATRRTWTDATAQFSVEAELVEVKDGKAMLRRANGKVLAVPVDKLSKADRDYLSSLDKNTP